MPDDRRALVVCPVGHLFGSDRYGIVTRRGRKLPDNAGALIRTIHPKFTRE
jgi:hypothetical protein